ncbi:exodeoxyribonuclease III [bacterium]|nr:exodeoxyribonuclease III [bacterium]MBU1635397.1 exodeoxyribonuclease III [bacterium]MBU1874365.1 exodeoxyribonuclease III [bacterium]
MQLISWNVNGIRSAHRKGFMEWFQKQNPDIFCVQETKAQMDVLPHDLLNIQGYHSVFSSAEKKGYSGVAVYSKRKPVQISTGLGISRFDHEGRTIVADFGEFVLFNIYFPNGQKNEERLKYKMDFYNAFLSVVDALDKEGRNVIVCGDVNTAHKEIDLAHPKENETTSGFLPMEREWIDKFLSHGWVDTFRMFYPEPEHYTWWSMRTRARERNIGWRIDYFYVNERFRKNVKDGFILPEVEGSDHCPIGLKISL